MNQQQPNHSPLHGLVIYFWGREEQDRLIRECLNSTLSELRRTGALSFFWFDRFGARGPHLLLIADFRHPVESIEFLYEAAAAYLKESPSTEQITQKELLHRHQQCRGKILCEADRLPGIASNNSLVSFEHPRDAYPFWLSTRMEKNEFLWQAIDQLFIWIIEQISNVEEQERRKRALLWAVAMDLVLREAKGNPLEYWGYHAESLWPKLREQDSLRDDRFREKCLKLIGTKNIQTFSTQWDSTPTDSIPIALVNQLVTAASSEESHGWQTLREINHWTLKNLGLPVHAHLPLTLFSWHRATLT